MCREKVIYKLKMNISSAFASVLFPKFVMEDKISA